ncbi:unnamed protein product [Prunus brigantina]
MLGLSSSWGLYRPRKCFKITFTNIFVTQLMSWDDLLNTPYVERNTAHDYFKLAGVLPTLFMLNQILVKINSSSPEKNRRNGVGALNRMSY